MTRTIRLFSTSVLLTVAGLASTASAATEATLGISAAGCFNSGTCFVKIVGAIPTADTTCTDLSKITFNVSTVAGEQMYKTALSAFLSGRKVVFNVASGTCILNAPTPYYLYAI
jgi:hypothetical protein